MTRPSVGVIVPAHDGAHTIHRSLEAILAQRWEGEVAVAVVCNGCHDDTRDRATAFAGAFWRRGWRFAVFESPPGRSAALNAGEPFLGTPALTLVVDQDAALTADAFAELSGLVARGAEFVAPRLDLTPGPGPVVRAYYRAWSSLPYVQRAPVTIGVYGFSRPGRERWGDFPAGLPDDKLVRQLFAPGARAVTPGAAYDVVVPPDLRSVLRARRGYRRSNRALAQHASALAQPAARERRAGLLRWCLHPRHWGGLALLVAVHGLAGMPRVRR